VPVTSAVLIDDLDAALAVMSRFGVDIVAAASRAVRDSLLLFASLHDMRVVRHDNFTGWVQDQIDPDYLWLSLDPFGLPQLKSGCEVRQLRLTRRAAAGQLVLEAALPAHIERIIAGRSVGLVDDAVASGGTIRHAAALVADAGGKVEDVVVCASTAKGRDAIRRTIPQLAWAEFVRGDHVALHMRDACAFLPFGGRKFEKGVTLHTTHGEVEVAYHPMAFPGSPWDEVAKSRHTTDAILHAARDIEYALSRALERPATAADVGLLGSHVAIPCYRRHDVQPLTLLKHLIG
jgi:hypothetical protein